MKAVWIGMMAVLASMAQADEGRFYLGGGLGMAYVNQSGPDESLTGIAKAYGSRVMTTHITEYRFDSSTETAWRLSGGMRLSGPFSLELALFDLGNASAEEYQHMEFTDGSFVDTTRPVNIHNRGASLGVVLDKPLHAGVRLLGGLALARTSQTRDYPQPVTSISVITNDTGSVTGFVQYQAHQTETETSTDLSATAGVAWLLSPRWESRFMVSGQAVGEGRVLDAQLGLFYRLP